MDEEIYSFYRREVGKDVEKIKKFLKSRNYENLTSQDVYKLNKNHNGVYYNCYGFAVYGLRYDDVLEFSGSPIFDLGFSTGFDFRDCETKQDVEALLRSDMKKINFKIKKATKDMLPNPLKNEVKIALYIEKSRNLSYKYEDYHFMVQDAQSGDWYQKMGYKYGIYKFSGTPPKRFKYEGFDGVYEFVNYYIIENKNRKDFCEKVVEDKKGKIPYIKIRDNI